MKKLRNQNGLTLTEMLCTVIIVLLFSSLVAVGANAAVRSFRISMADSRAQELCSTLTSCATARWRPTTRCLFRAWAMWKVRLTRFLP